jgi:hypothetical protein
VYVQQGYLLFVPLKFAGKIAEVTVSCGARRTIAFVSAPACTIRFGLAASSVSRGMISLCGAKELPLMYLSFEYCVYSS